ncbi:hypothetical protein [Mucilaginibacter sp. PPCGB 2223]|uniref:hypothetical protein n=1 Tax=Mucilaginibacter sp. PPCGB 2223 TaxID=1886027 RepID=UPI0011125533|nr:hypothetical protein [Mucilaginibacter sp. PPCGB 2223]
MLHESRINVSVPSRAAHTAATGAKSLPAVPVLQQKTKAQDSLLQRAEESEQLQGDNSAAAVTQMKPADWAASATIAAVILHQPGYFSTWKKIVKAINEYKVLPEDDYAARGRKLDLMTTLIATWKEGHKNDTTARVVGIRGALPGLEGLIVTERAELLFAQNVRQYATAGTTYTSRTRGDVSFTVAKQGDKLNVLSANPQIAGHIQYDLTRASIDLKHFEAQPEGLGIGSVLMHEFARFAGQMGLATVNVLTPAYSAMGAYDFFGGIPQAGKQGAFDTRRGQYETVMGLRNDDERGERIADDHDDETYTNFINEEAKAVGKTAANKAKFATPEISADDLERVEALAVQAHKDRYVRNVDNVKRAARLKALSGFLSYNIAALLDRTRGQVAGKWIVGE